MFKHAGTGNLSLLGHMADQHNDRSGFLGETDERLGCARNLGHRAGCRLEGVDEHRLHGVHHDDLDRALGLEVARMPRTSVAAASLTGESDNASRRALMRT